MSVYITYFVHGTTTDNEHGLATGWKPGELSQKGIEQSQALRGMLGNKTFDVVISSDLARAVESAQLCFGKDGIPLAQDARLRECNYGDHNGAPAAAFKTDMKKNVDIPYPHGESYKDVEARMRAFCKDLFAQYDGKRVALVAHEAPQLALDVIVKGKTWDQALDENWRHTKAWQPGWKYVIEQV